MLAQARAQTLRDWIARFPGEVSKSNPWWTYWQGVSLVAAQPTHASEVLGTVFERFKDVGDELGQALTASGIIRAIYLEWADLTKIDPWIDVLRALIEKGLVFPSQEAELQAYSSAVIAIFNRRPADPFLRRASERAMELLCAPLDPNLKVTAGVALLLYYITQLGGGHGKQVIELVQPSLESGSVSPLNQMYWFTRVGLFWAHRGRYGASLQPIARGEAIAREGRAEFRSVVAFMPGIAYSVMTQDLRAAETRVEAMEASMTAGHILDECFLNVGQTYLLDIRGDLSRAADSALRAENRATERGMFFARVSMAVGAAALLACAGRLDEALARVNDARKLIAGTFLADCEFDLQLVEAHVALTQGDRAECGRLMRLAIPKLAAREFGFVRHTPRLKATLYAEALRQGIEPAQVQAMIREDRLQPPSSENEYWPWTVKVRALGDFRVEAEAIKSSGKSHYRLLEFVKALVALGGVGVNATTLTELLWPESEGDAAQRVFHTSLHRLRKLLGGESAIFLEDGKLSLNLELCWSDVTTFEFVAKQVEAVGNEQEATTEALVKFAERLMDLYRGPLLAQEDDKPWVLGSRDRLRSQFRRLVSRLAEGLEAKSEFELAISIYRNALERENLSEDIYRRLMDCHQRRGEYAEALNVYRRCRELLSVILGVQPSQQTQKLYAAIRLHA